MSRWPRDRLGASGRAEKEQVWMARSHTSMGAGTPGRLLAKAAAGAGGPCEPWLAGKSADSQTAVARVCL